MATQSAFIITAPGSRSRNAGMEPKGKDQSQYLRNNYHILKIGLIGSFARDEQTDMSDIDLLVEFEQGFLNILMDIQTLMSFMRINEILMPQ